MAVATGAAAFAPLGALLFHGHDQLRRLGGAWLDLAGFAPLQTPSRVLGETAGMRLRSYGTARAGGPQLLVVPAPIKRHWIWDPRPCCSVVRHGLRRGCGVHLAEWTQAAADWGLDEHVQAVGHCVEQVERRTGRTPHLLAHSLGGVLAATHAALHPARAASLVLVEAPLRFGPASGAFAPLLPAPPWPPASPRRASSS